MSSIVTVSGTSSGKEFSGLLLSQLLHTSTCIKLSTESALLAPEAMVGVTFDEHGTHSIASISVLESERLSSSVGEQSCARALTGCDNGIRFDGLARIPEAGSRQDVILELAVIRGRISI